MKYRRQSGTFRFEEDLFSKNEGRISKLYLEVILLMQFLQTKPQVKKLILILIYKKTVFKNEDDKQFVNEYEYENKELD